MASRSYSLGLPVWVTVHEDGRVEWEVDRSETADAILEDESIYGDDDGEDFSWSEDEKSEDAERVQQFLAAGGE